jgi:hypothetical protein
VAVAQPASPRLAPVAALVAVVGSDEARRATPASGGDRRGDDARQTKKRRKEVNSHDELLVSRREATQRFATLAPADGACGTTFDFMRPKRTLCLNESSAVSDAADDIKVVPRDRRHSCRLAACSCSALDPR